MNYIDPLRTDKITTSNPNTTRPCAYFMGYTVYSGSCGNPLYGCFQPHTRLCIITVNELSRVRFY